MNAQAKNIEDFIKWVESQKPGVKLFLEDNEYFSSKHVKEKHDLLEEFKKRNIKFNGRYGRVYKG
jgi:hypothetical protein